MTFFNVKVSLVTFLFIEAVLLYIPAAAARRRSCRGHTGVRFHGGGSTHHSGQQGSDSYHHTHPVAGIQRWCGQQGMWLGTVLLVKFIPGELGDMSVKVREK